jgi:hypothetical protein
MANAGYSGTPLLKKLGIKPEHAVRLVNPPDDYFELLGDNISSQVVKSGGNFAHVFVKSRKELETAFGKLSKSFPPEGIIWISWYKKSAKIPTDVTEDVIREVVLPTGWVDVKVCAVSEIWSGLKIVKRLSERK